MAHGILPLTTIATILFVTRFVRRSKAAWAIVAGAILIDMLGLNVLESTWYCEAILIFIALVAWLAARRSIVLWRRDARHPLVLDPPFVGRWSVVAGGAFPGRNHHLIASDQRYAYDFVRKDAKSFGSTILAPCDGVIVSLEKDMVDLPPSMNPNRPGSRGRELGNHVGIETSRGTVFLCHLQSGSVCVQLGESVRAGSPIGACGNSGRTTKSHLHIHAQNLPRYALCEAVGVPIAFVEHGGRPRVLEFRDGVDGAVV